MPWIPGGVIGGAVLGLIAGLPLLLWLRLSRRTLRSLSGKAS
jgi:hypothetical protein